MSSIPAWFSQLMSFPPDSKKNLARKLKGQQSEAVLNDLVAIFGRTNQNLVISCLDDQVKETFKAALLNNHVRFEQLRSIALKTLARNKPLNLDLLSPFYENSASLPGDPIPKRVVSEMIGYLFSLPMPYQTARALDCHSVEKIHAKLKNLQTELEQTIGFLFQRCLGSLGENEPLGLTLRQEQLLFKYAALKGHGIVITWGSFVISWIKISKDGPLVKSKIQKEWHFDKLLISQEMQDSPQKKSEVLSFQDYAVRETVRFLFRHPKTKLPKDILEEGLTQVFSASIQDQHDAVYYIDYLHQMFLTHVVTFEEALTVLNRMVPDQAAVIYTFLHTSLHFFNCILQFQVEESALPILFKFLFTVDPLVRCQFDKAIQESHCRLPSQIDRALFQLIESEMLPTKVWEKIILKSARSIPPREVKPNPFMSLNQHLELLQKIKSELGLQLPEDLMSNFLLFQTASPDIFKVVDGFIEIRNAIAEKCTDSLAIPRDLYQEFQVKASEFIGSLVLDISIKFPVCMKNNQIAFMNNMLQLIGFLHLSVYPQPVIPIAQLMPLAIEDGNLQFNSEGAKHLNCLELIFPDFPTGPAHQFTWICDEINRKIVFCTTLASSVKDPQFTRTFEVTLEILRDPVVQPYFFKLLSAFVDNLGKEVLSDDDLKKLEAKQFSTDYSVPTKILEMKGAPSELFDEFVHLNPLLNEIWQQHEHHFGEDTQNVKAQLYQFIQSFRSQLKRGFYQVLNSKRL